MDTNYPSQNAHPKGESKTTPNSPRASWPLDTPGGRFHAEWDDQAPVTRDGQLIFFFQFLQAGARWQEFLRECPLHYVGNRGSGADNVMGTILLSVLSGHWRYAHINGIRGDGINPGLLGLDGTVSEDAVRAAMKRIDETQGLNWLSTQIIDTIRPALHLPWILDMDVTVKPLYGNQQGAEIGYTPQKPGRPARNDCRPKSGKIFAPIFLFRINTFSFFQRANLHRSAKMMKTSMHSDGSFIVGFSRSFFRRRKRNHCKYNAFISVTKIVTQKI